MNKRPGSLHEKIARLRETFIAQLPARLGEMRRLVATLVSHPGDDATLSELHRLLHSIKGTAASFGLKTLSTSAAQGESLSRRLEEERAERSAANIMRLADLLDILEGHIAASAEGSKTTGAPGAPIFELPEAHSTDAPGEMRRLIYLCDDDEVQVEQLSTQLACFGYQTVPFTDPAALRSAVEARRPDVVIMDIIFPEGASTGLEVIGELQRNQNPPLPVIFISGRRDFDARLRAVQAGGSAYFPKPVQAMELVETLDTLTAVNAPEPFRILVVDDEPAVAEYHALLLNEAGMETTILNTPEKVLGTLYELKPDLVLMDMYMPLCNGRELAQVIRQMPDFVSLPIVYLSSETDSAKQFSALRVGADGFLTKPIRPEELVPAVALRAERMRTLRSLMVRDSLTGLFNHTTTKQFLESATHTACRREEPLCFAMIDVDHFKSVNDSYGHPVGDQVLLALSRLLQQRLRLSDVVGRYGGEEFAVILPNTNTDNALRVMNGLREDFARIRFEAEGSDFSCSFSCGIAAYPAFDCPDSLNQAADKALYEAKHQGRNRVAVQHA